MILLKFLVLSSVNENLLDLILPSLKFPDLPPRIKCDNIKCGKFLSILYGPYIKRGSSGTFRPRLSKVLSVEIRDMNALRASVVGYFVSLQELPESIKSVGDSKVRIFRKKCSQAHF